MVHKTRFKRKKSHDHEKNQSKKYNVVYKKQQMAEQEQSRLQKLQMVYEENQACHAVIHDTRHFLYTVQNLLEHADIEEAKKLLQDCSDVKLTNDSLA